MDRRYEAYKLLEMQGRQAVATPPDDTLKAQVLTEGKEGEFWRTVREEIDQQIRAAESRFLDTLAKDYESYVALWSRRQALIAVLAIPETAKKEDVR